MAGMNMLAARGAFSMITSAASGYSCMAISYTFPGGLEGYVGGTVLVAVRNMSVTEAVHVELRSTWTDLAGVSQVATLGLGLSGTSALTIQKIGLVGSNDGGVFPYTNVVGSALQVIILNAQSGVSAIGTSGVVALWAL